MAIHRCLWLGLGCNRGSSRTLIAHAVQGILQEQDLEMAAIAAITTLDTKMAEAGLVAFCRDHHVPLRGFRADQLHAVSVPHPSPTIQPAVGTPSVAEAAALLSCQTWGGGHAILHVPKTIIRIPGEPGAVTLAIAMAPPDSAVPDSSP